MTAVVEWICGECRVLNEITRVFCEMCGSMRPGHTAESPASSVLALPPVPWHFDEVRQVAVRADQHAPGDVCPFVGCAFYGSPPSRVGDLVSASDSIAVMRARFGGAMGRI